jgi:hypothetical protein
VILSDFYSLSPPVRGLILFWHIGVFEIQATDCTDLHWVTYTLLRNLALP